MDLCQVGLATGADIDDILCDGAVPIKGSHPGQHLTPLRVVGDGDIEWSIRHLCVQGEGRRYDKGTLESVADGSHGRPEMAVTCSTGRNTQKEMGGTYSIGYGERSSDYARSSSTTNDFSYSPHRDVI